MAEIINLRMARKRKKRADDAARADTNRLAFGRSKIEKARTGAEKTLAERQLESRRLDKEE